MSEDEQSAAENDALLDRIEKAAAELKEHCDSVRIFCTLHRDDTKETTFLDVGKGNFYAQHGQIQEWLTVQDQRTRNLVIKRDQEE